jgi:hypothetical protein
MIHEGVGIPQQLLPALLLSGWQLLQAPHDLPQDVLEMLGTTTALLEQPQHPAQHTDLRAQDVALRPRQVDEDRLQVRQLFLEQLGVQDQRADGGQLGPGARA